MLNYQSLYIPCFRLIFLLLHVRPTIFIELYEIELANTNNYNCSWRNWKMVPLLPFANFISSQTIYAFIQTNNYIVASGGPIIQHNYTGSFVGTVRNETACLDKDIFPRAEISQRIRKQMNLAGGSSLGVPPSTLKRSKFERHFNCGGTMARRLREHGGTFRILVKSWTSSKPHFWQYSPTLSVIIYNNTR